MEGESLIALPTDQPQGYIFGGVNATPHEFPYQVRLGSWNGGICGGTIIHTLFILTAAHCLHNANKNRWKVYAGDHSRSYTDELTEQIRKISHVYAHDEFDSVTYENDIALLVLMHPLEFNEYVNNISYPRKKNTNYEVNATASGWGKLALTDIYVPDILQKVTVPLVSKWECQKRYNNTKQRVTNDMICAGSSTADACVGDSGGPLTCVEKVTGRKVVCGIVAFGIGCGRKEFPGVYTDVSHYWQWIELTMAKYIHGENFLAIDSIVKTTPTYLANTTTVNHMPHSVAQTTSMGVVSTLDTVSAASCKDLKVGSHSLNGVYNIKATGAGDTSIKVYCDMEDVGGGWTVIQRRGVRRIPKAQRESFYRNWTDYENGFGSPDDDYWIGLRNMHTLTHQCENELKITLTRWNGTEYFGGYANFQVAGMDDDYRLTLGTWTSGNLNHDYDRMEVNNGMKFTTFDKDNDDSWIINCSEHRKGGWWHSNCTLVISPLKYMYKIDMKSSMSSLVNLNGEYAEDNSKGTVKGKWSGIYWWPDGEYYSYMKSEMKIRPNC